MDQPDLDHRLDYDDNDDDDDDDEQEANRTQPFQPGTVSTPYHGGEQHEMRTMHHEQSGLPETSFDEIPSLGGFIHEDDKPARLEKAKEFIKVSATLQDRPRADHCSAFVFNTNPYKPYIF